ncbi:unnamed protein product, partial [Ectocarpus sp. 8 AP-2014]
SSSACVEAVVAIGAFDPVHPVPFPDKSGGGDRAPLEARVAPTYLHRYRLRGGEGCRLVGQEGLAGDGGGLLEPGAAEGGPASTKERRLRKSRSFAREGEAHGRDTCVGAGRGSSRYGGGGSGEGGGR